MDLQTENRIAAILMKEAAEMRRQAEKEGVHVYLQKPNARARPNSRFLTSTVLGVQQSNRAVEVNEMWRVRQKELELDGRLKGKVKEESSNSRNHRESNSSRSTSKRHTVTNESANSSCSSSKRAYSSHSGEDDGLRDEELEEFLCSRAKRGRGAVGSRMDETGPYLPPCPESKEEKPTSSNIIERRAVYGPEKPNSLKPCKYSEEDDDDDDDDDRRKKPKKVNSKGSKKQHSEKKRSKDRSKDKKKKRKERRKHNK